MSAREVRVPGMVRTYSYVHTVIETSTELRTVPNSQYLVPGIYSTPLSTTIYCTAYCTTTPTF